MRASLFGIQWSESSSESVEIISVVVVRVGSAVGKCWPPAKPKRRLKWTLDGAEFAYRSRTVR